MMEKHKIQCRHDVTRCGARGVGCQHRLALGRESSPGQREALFPSIWEKPLQPQNSNPGSERGREREDKREPESYVQVHRSATRSTHSHGTAPSVGGSRPRHTREGRHLPCGTCQGWSAGWIWVARVGGVNEPAPTRNVPKISATQNVSCGLAVFDKRASLCAWFSEMTATRTARTEARWAARARKDNRKARDASALLGGGGLRPEHNAIAAAVLCVCPPIRACFLSQHVHRPTFLGTATPTWSKRQAGRTCRADLRQAERLQLVRLVRRILRQRQRLRRGINWRERGEMPLLLLLLLLLCCAEDES